MELGYLVQVIKELKKAKFTGQLEINFHKGGMGKSYTRQQISTPKEN